MKYQMIKDPRKEAEETEKQLSELENLVFRMNQLWKKQFSISATALILILILLSVFICGATICLRAYPAKQLMWELVKNVRMTFTAITYETRQELPPDFSKYFAEEFRKKLRKEIPHLKLECRQNFDRFFLHTKSFMKPLLKKHLTAALENHSYRFLKTRGIQANESRRTAIRVMNETLAEKMAEQLCSEMVNEKVLRHLSRELELLQKSEEYGKLSTEVQILLEDRLIEDFLELMVFQINKVKGLRPAAGEELR